jgi:cell division protein FtsB
VETAKAAEFEAINKQLEASKQRCAALQNSTKGIAAQLATLQGAARALAKDYKTHRAQSRSQVVEMGQSIMTQYKPILVGKLKVRVVGPFMPICTA